MLALGVCLFVWLALGLAIFNGYGGNGKGKKTATAGTKISVLVPPTQRGYTRISKIVYTAGTTAHTITVMRPIGRTTVASAAAAGQAVVNLTAQPLASNAVAAGDFLAIRRAADGITRLYEVTSVASLAITMTANLATGEDLAAGDKVWFFGVAGDTNPADGEAHPGLTGTASATTTYTDTDGGVVAGYAKDDPLVVQSNNATVAGTVEQVSWANTQM